MSIEVRIRHVVVNHSIDGHPWANLAWAGDGFGLDQASDPWSAVEWVEWLHSLAATIWKQAGINLVIDSIVEVDSDKFFRLDLREEPNGLQSASDREVHEDLIARFSNPRTYSICAFWVRRARETVGGWVGRTWVDTLYEGDPGEFHWVRGTGVVLSSGTEDPGLYQGDPLWWRGWILAHELGHVFGNMHTFYGDKSDAWGLAPFPDDVPPVGSFGEDRNVMTYPAHLNLLDTIPNFTGLEIEEFRVTTQQGHRTRLTLFSGLSPIATLNALTELVSEELGDSITYTSDAYADFVSQHGERPVLPDVLAPLHAAWMG